MDTYKSEVSQGLSAAWKLAREQVQKAQRRQKTQHDLHARDPGFRVGDRVFVLMPAKRQGKAHKFARPFGGPYRIVAMCENGAEVKLIDKPQSDTIRVALNRVRRCPVEIPDSGSPDKDSSSNVEVPPLNIGATADQAQSGVWQNRLRPRK